jgi:hypothetical protein
MSKWQIYVYLAGQRRENVIQAWLRDERVPTAQIAAFQDKIDTLEANGPEMVPGFISETPVAKDIYKMKIKGNKGMKQLRPMCCRGPFGPSEYTILLGAVEKDRALIPKDAIERAQANLVELKADPTRRTHERLTSKPQLSPEPGAKSRIHIAPKPNGRVSG